MKEHHKKTQENEKASAASMSLGFGKLDWLFAGALVALSALLYFISLANYAFPGESAHLLVLWRGLDVTATPPYPVMAFFAKLFGTGNLLAPICGVFSTVAIYFLVAFFIRLRSRGEYIVMHSETASRIAGLTASVVFMLTPAVREAATHLEPRMFAVAWALGALLLVIPWCKNGRLFPAIAPILFGVLWGIGLFDAPLFIALSPLAILACWAASYRCGRHSYVDALIFVVVMLVTFGICLFLGSGSLTDVLKMLSGGVTAYMKPKGWMWILFFTTIPFVVALFSSQKAYSEESGWVQWTFHSAMGFASILAIATPLAPSTLMERYGVMPVATSVFAAFVAGYMLSYWWLLTVVKVRQNESSDKLSVNVRGRLFGYSVGGLLAVVYLIATLFNLFTFSGDRGQFADKMAERIVKDLDTRTWFVTDGSLDDHIRLVCEKTGREVNLISLNRDLDRAYLNRLSDLVKEKKVGGEKNRDLVLSLSLGVLPFVQDWFAADTNAFAEVAIFGAPDLWYSAGRQPVPEFAFFGADPKRVPDPKAWEEFRDILTAPKGWGSYRLMRQATDPVEHLRLELRRHLGLVANDRGVWLQEHNRNDEAYDAYSLVFDEIDTDNICSLFNLFEMARAKHPKAIKRKSVFDQRLKAVVDDADRRYRLWSLANYYGYIRNPGIYIRLGFTWARSGRPGEALSQIRRAIDFVPTDRRSAILNMMAALYASEDDRTKSREVYTQVLAKNERDHDALIGMMRLSLEDGDSAKALEYLERATAAGGDDPRVQVEVAMAALMRGDLVKAKKILKQVTDAKADDLRAWSLMAAVTMQQCDGTKDEKQKKVFEKELEETILPKMEKQARGPYDYYVQTTRAFILMRKGEKNRRAARDAFAVAAKVRPDIAATRDLVLGLDISLDDKPSAESHARDTLRRDRKSPIANYVMGSLALQKGEYEEAEQYLRRAADARKGVPLAMNDLAEVYRRFKRWDEGERYARMAVKANEKLYVAWETLGTIIVERGGDLAEAQRCIQKACDMSIVDGKPADVRMLVSLARVQIKRGEKRLGKMTLRKVQNRLGELSAFERAEYEELKKSAQ